MSEFWSAASDDKSSDTDVDAIRVEVETEQPEAACHSAEKRITTNTSAHGPSYQCGRRLLCNQCGPAKGSDRRPRSNLFGSPSSVRRSVHQMLSHFGNEPRGLHTTLSRLVSKFAQIGIDHAGVGHDCFPRIASTAPQNTTHSSCRRVKALRPLLVTS